MAKKEMNEFIPLMELPLTNGFLFGETMYDVDGIHKGIRLDIYVKDVSGRIYNVEMQTENRYNIPKRSRHYQAVIDSKLFPAGEIDYSKLNDTIIIFICTFDLFGQKRYLYEFENRCIQDTALCLGDGCRKVYLNTQGLNEEEVSTELLEFLHMLKQPEMNGIQSPRVKKIYNRVETVKRDSQVEARYMRELTYERELIEQGIEQGVEQGIEQERRGLVEKKLAKGQTPEQIADAIELEINEVEKIISELQ